jgi:hypothetical protein
MMLADACAVKPIHRKKPIQAVMALLVECARPIWWGRVDVGISADESILLGESKAESKNRPLVHEIPCRKEASM